MKAMLAIFGPNGLSEWLILAFILFGLVAAVTGMSLVVLFAMGVIGSKKKG